MAASPAEMLLRRMQTERRWPLAAQAEIEAEIRLWRALRDSDREVLRQASNWAGTRPYLVDPVGELITGAFADLLWRDEPVIEAAAEGDQANLGEIVKGNRLGVELRRMEDGVKGPEGEVWWRVYSNPALHDVPLVQWHSRAAVIPQWSGSRLAAVAFFSRLYDTDPRGRVAWRHFEIHEPRRVLNVLFKGTNRFLGERVALTSHEALEGLRDEWRHGLPMLAGWIPNRYGPDPHRGVSDYHAVQDMLLELNEALSTGAENRKLVAKKRVVVHPSVLDEHGRLPAGDEVLAFDPEAGAGGDVSGPNAVFRELEYSFDAQALIAYQNDLAVKTLNRKGITPHFVGASNEDGAAPSGVALRLRLVPTIAAGEGKGAPVDQELPEILARLMQVDALGRNEGGYGRSYSSPADPPAVTRVTAVPEDRVERAERIRTAVTGGFMSVYQAVTEDHPEWDDEQVQNEVDRIRGDEIATPPRQQSRDTPAPPDSGAVFAGDSQD